MSFDPTSIIALIENCMKVYSYAADIKHSSSERRRLLDEVRSLEPELEALNKLATSPGVSGNQASMEQLAQLLDPSQPFTKLVDETLDRIKDVLTYGTSDPKAHRFKVLGRRGAAALWWTVNKGEVKDLLVDLERYKSRIGLALQHDMFKKQDAMDGKLDNMERHVSNEVRLRIAEFISPNDYTSDCKHLQEKKLSGTGTWLLRHRTFVAWRDKIYPNRTLWCYGHPGAGKSVMAALIIEHLQFTPNNVVLSVFCRYSSNIFITPYAVLGGLLRQLIEKTTRVPRAVCDSYWSKTNIRPDAITGFLDDIAASHGRPIYIVIDALDECSFGSDLLRALEHLNPSFRVLVTSRPVFKEMEEYPSIQIRASDDDILVAVDTTILKLKGAWCDDALKRLIRAKIVEKADGMFLLASLQLRQLECDVTCKGDVIAILQSLPHTLDDAYRLTFQRIREQGERKHELACHALALIALPQIRWRPKELQHCLSEGDEAQYTDIETILHSCHGLVRKNTYDFFEFIHYSVYEYTIAHWSKVFPENPKQRDICLTLGYAVLTSPVDDSGRGVNYWHWIVEVMKEPEEVEQVISFLSTPEARASFVEDPKLAPFVRDSLLIACHFQYGNVMEYMIRTAPPDVQRFNEALCMCRDWDELVEECIEWINARPDVRVNRRGVVVAVDSNKVNQKLERGRRRRGL